jgi:AraC-like DNA-binding protein
MVCNRCKSAVRSILESFDVHPESVELGEVELPETIGKELLVDIDRRLRQEGFELIDDRKSRLAEKVKNIIVELVHERSNDLKTNLSDYITQRIPQDYSHISSIFSQVESVTIEQYYILQKIERVKELLVYDELNLNEIAALLNYSSASHLTKQFKKVTGLTPSYFKELREQKRRSIDNL